VRKGKEINYQFNEFRRDGQSGRHFTLHFLDTHFCRFAVSSAVSLQLPLRELIICKKIEIA